jgi:hypothetical protein
MATICQPAGGKFQTHHGNGACLADCRPRLGLPFFPLVSSSFGLPLAFSLQPLDFHPDLPSQQLLHQPALLFLQRLQLPF